MRYGLLDNLELRLGFDFLESKTELNNLEFGNREAGFSPLLVGVKVGIAKENGLLPEIGLLDHFWDAGITYTMKNNIQLDALIGTGIENSQKLMFGGGISLRLPK